MMVSSFLVILPTRSTQASVLPEYYVDDDYTSSTPGWQVDHFDVIQDAIDESSNGDTICVYSGTYYENLFIDKSINLFGEDKNTTIIDGGFTGECIYVDSDWINISDFTIQNGDVDSFCSGVKLVSSSHVQITGNIIQNNPNTPGILLESYCNYNIIKDNILTNNFYGMRFYDSLNNSIEGNIIIDNIHVGIRFENSSNSSIIGNSIDNVEFGVTLGYSSNNNNLRELVINNVSQSSIYISNSKYNNVAGNELSYNRYGVRLVYSENNLIDNNTITDNNDNGVHIEKSSNNTVSNNFISNNAGEGVYFQSIFDPSYNNILIGNTITNNANGVRLISSIGASVIYNDISNNVGYGIRVDGLYHGHSYNNILRGNTIADNIKGIVLDDTTGCVINNNSMVENSIYVSGDSLSYWNTHTIEASNTVNDKPVFYYNGENNVVVPPEVGQVIIANCTNITLENQKSDSLYMLINLGFSSYCKIINNNLKGINLQSSSHNDIKENIIENGDGAFLASSDHNVITKNRISKSNVGIRFYPECYNNLVYHNDLIDNNENTFGAGNNIWYNPTLQQGNYYDDYTGSDTNGDGIGDIPYAIAACSNQDLYPLMEPYSAFDPPEDPELFLYIDAGIGLLFNKVGASVKNLGEGNASNINLSLSVEYGLIQTNNYNKSVSTELLEPGESHFIELDGLRGFGFITMNAKVTSDETDELNDQRTGLILGRLIFIF